MKLDSTFKSQVEEIEQEIKSIKLESNKTKSINHMLSLFQNFIQDNIKEKIAIAFSGGVDSTFITFLCKTLKKPFHLYSVGLPGSKDLEQAQLLAKEYNLPLTFKEINSEDAEKIIKEVTKLLKTNDPIKIGVGSTFYSVLELVNKDNHKTIMTGLGSEEIFAGYQRHKEALTNNRVNEECFTGLKTMYLKDLERDNTIANHFKIKAIAPFLNKEIVTYAMSLDPKLKINSNQNKILVRLMAESLGIKKEYCERKKIAAQYGSRFDNHIGKLAKRSGFKYKKDYLQSLI